MKKNDKRKKLPITKSTIENAAFWSIFLEATEKTQQPFLKILSRISYAFII
jgi:hypothetical protein